MIVTLAPGQGSVSICKPSGNFFISPKETKDAPFHLIRDLLERGILVKATYPEIKNDQVVVVDTASGRTRPIGVPGPRKGKDGSR